MNLPSIRGVLLVAGLEATTAQAADSALSMNKSAYHLLDPTPARLLRPMSTDGPGTTESAYTVDAGHFQIEMTLASYARDQDSIPGVAERVETWSIAPMLLRAVLRNSLEAQVALEPYHHVEIRDSTGRTTLRGFGDTTLRLKANIWGNDGGPTAFAITPYLKLPTGDVSFGRSRVEGGVVLPFEATLPSEFYLGLTTRFEAVQDEEGEGYHAEFVNSIAFGHDLIEEIFGYVEFFSAVSAKRSTPWVGALGTGLIWTLTENFQLNVGMHIGLTRFADDWGSFAGLAWRF